MAMQAGYYERTGPAAEVIRIADADLLVVTQGLIYECRYVQSVADKKSAMPILGNVLIVAEGGGVRCEQSKLTLTASTVDANVAQAGGGGLYATGCTLDVRGVTFTANRTDLLGGGALLDGTTGTIADSRFLTNDAHDVGGAIATRQGDVTIVGNELRDNVGHRGGGIYTAGAVRIQNNQIIGNDARWTGGGLHLVGAALVPINTRFKGAEAAYLLARSGAGAPYPHLAAYHQRMLARPAYQKGIEVGGPVVMA